jgi:putative endonuclease
MRPSGSRPKSPDRQLAETYGRRGEWVAAWFLRLKGYRIRDTRVKTPVGEIDLVAERFGTVVFVEVKARARRESDFDPLLSVNVNRIARAAQYYVARHPRLAERDHRFDVILLAPMTWPRHVVNAAS